jgi:hypothetical protein
VPSLLIFQKSADFEKMFLALLDKNPKQGGQRGIDPPPKLDSRYVPDGGRRTILDPYLLRRYESNASDKYTSNTHLKVNKTKKFAAYPKQTSKNVVILKVTTLSAGTTTFIIANRIYDIG